METVTDYHERTKHQLDRYARALGYLDWATQPDPFRRFEGARLILLDEVQPGPAPPYDAVFGSAVITQGPINRATISQLFFDSLELSAWKATGQVRWSLRVNPSSGCVPSRRMGTAILNNTVPGHILYPQTAFFVFPLS